MLVLNFVAGDTIDLKNFENVISFVECYPDFQTVVLSNEKELLLLLEMMGVSSFEVHLLENSDFSKLWDISICKLPEFTREQFDQFYQKWINISERRNTMDEYGNLIFLCALSARWNTLPYRLVVM